MPDTRALQTYSALLEDRRIMETAAEAREPPSLVLHLLEKEWSIRPGRNQNSNGPGARRFSYAQPISDLLEDIQERRIPTEFTDVFKKADIKFFEGCLLVEMHDSRPVKGAATKIMEPSVTKLILRPTVESLWADIRSLVDSQRGWGDKEALELEARIVLSTAPPLCLDPSPSVNRTANVISRSGADPSITSSKRKQSDDIEDDVESIKRRKLVQMMNPRFGKTFEPKFKILAAKHALLQKSQEGPSTATAPKNPAPPARPQPNPTNASMANMPQPVAQMAIQSKAQTEAIARQRLADLRVPPDAQQAAKLLQHRNRLAADQQKLAQTQAAVRNATMASNSAVSNGAPPQAPPNANPNPMVKTEQDAMAQMTSLQNGKAPFALSMPPVAKRSSTAAMPSSSSPPKASLPVPPNGTPQRTAHNLQVNDMQQPAANVPTASQTPRQPPATPQVSHQQPPAVPGPTAGNAPGQPQGIVPTPALASYHQGLVNGQQNQMHTLAQGAAGYPNGAAGVMRPVYPGMGNTYTMNGTVVGRPPMMPQQMGQISQITMMQQQQMMQNAYQMNMNGFGPTMQGMHPNLQQQMAQMQQMQQHAAAAVGSMYAGQNGAAMQANPQAQQAAIQQYNTFIWGRVDTSLANMPPERIADFVAKAPEQVKHSAQWAGSNEREKARITLFHLYKQKMMLDNARRAQSASAANAAVNFDLTHIMPPPAQTMAQAASASGQNGGMMGAAQQVRLQQFNIFIWQKVDLSLASMTPDQIADLITKASDQVKRFPQWATSSDRDKARLILFHLFKQKVMLDNARRMQAANSANVVPA